MNKSISFILLDFYSYWYHRACHKFDLPWHNHHHQKGTSAENSCLVESTISGLLIYSGIKVFENSKYIRVCRTTSALYWALVSSSHYLGHKLDYSEVFPINKIQIKHFFHHENSNYNFSIILPFDVLFGTSSIYLRS